jgi:FAD/FMN-containing dehydrogenase
LFNAAVQLQRWSGWLRRRGLGLMWATSGKPEVTLRSRRLLLWDTAPRAFEHMLLQKYFVPVDRFPQFVDQVGQVFAEHERLVPVLMHHFRFVPGNDEALLSPASSDSVCLIPCYLAKKGSQRWLHELEIVTHRLLSAALELGGSYYLTFDILPTLDMFCRAYPRWNEFQASKQRFDPQNLFTSRFADKYFAPRSAAPTASSGRSEHALA